jgi:DNA topoisomerase I
MIIYRKKINEGKKIYVYVDSNNNEIKDNKILDYINNQIQPIPPAYDDVEIFYQKNPKILFQGIDKNGRLQQIYSKKWRASADKKKFNDLIDFGRKLPAMKLIMNKNINSHINSKDKIISIILQITSLCGFRVGQLKYQKLYGSIGLSTLMKKNIKLKKQNELHINFIGKKGVKNDCIITDPILIRELLKLSKEKSANDFIFLYDDKNVNNNKKLITAIDINNWLKLYNPDFTSKFFRTFAVNSMFIKLLQKTMPSSMTLSQRKKKITEIIHELSCSINNTPAICKKSYIMPELIELYIQHPKKYNAIINQNTDPSLLFIQFLEKYA